MSTSDDATTLASLGIGAGETITINDGINSLFTYTSTGTDTVANLVSAINAANSRQHLDVSAALAQQQRQARPHRHQRRLRRLPSAAPRPPIRISASAPAHNSSQPTNLLTQGAVAPGDTMTISVNGTPTVITFGTGPTDVATLAQLQAAIGGIAGLTGTVNTANGDVSLTSNSNIVLDGSPTALLSEFGINKDAAYPATDQVIANDSSTFTAQSVDGGSITAYDGEGNPVNVQFRWAETSAGSWQLFYQSNSNATGTQPAWQNVGTVFNFNSSGELSPAISSVTLQNLTVNNDNLGNVQLNFGANGLTQFANSSGTAQVSQIPAERLCRRPIAVGRGRQPEPDHRHVLRTARPFRWRRSRWRRSTARIRCRRSTAALTRPRSNSGPPIYGATGTVVGSSLEASNVDISTQFSQLIVAQQAYSANARVMSTADQMIQSLLQVIQ